jgi:hypothetical protein
VIYESVHQLHVFCRDVIYESAVTNNNKGGKCGK